MDANVLEMSGKTIDEAKDAAIKALGADRSEVEFEILEVGSKGIFGIGAKPAVVRATRRFDPEKIALSFIKQMGATMNLPITAEAQTDERHLNITLAGPNMGILIGKRGQTLDAIQYLVSLAVNKGTAPYISVVVDAESYRLRRRENLEQLALNLAKKAKATRKPVTLEPMNTAERRIIHAILQNDKSISTYSEGKEPYRSIVISTKRHPGRGRDERPPRGRDNYRDNSRDYNVPDRAFDSRTSIHEDDDE